MIPDKVSSEGTFGARALDGDWGTGVGILPHVGSQILEAKWRNRHGYVVELLIWSVVAREISGKDIQANEVKYVRGVEFAAVEQYNDELAEFVPEHVFEAAITLLKAYKMGLL